MKAIQYGAETKLQKLELSPNSWISYTPNWLQASQAAPLMAKLGKSLQWEKGQIRMFGKWLSIPRQHAWYGDAQANYGWSGQRAEPLPWAPELEQLRQALQQDTGALFNGVLANLYRDGEDCMHWHSDDETELGRQPLVAAISIGAERRFSLRHKSRAYPTHRLQLGHGSLLLMGGDCQHDWQHALPRSTRVDKPRISLTYRYIHSTNR